MGSVVTETDCCRLNDRENLAAFATEKLALSAIAMARISQIIANDERFGGLVTDKEWGDSNLPKYIIARHNNDYVTSYVYCQHCLLAFHTVKQRDLFLEENKELVKQYLMID